MRSLINLIVGSSSIIIGLMIIIIALLSACNRNYFIVNGLKEVWLKLSLSCKYIFGILLLFVGGFLLSDSITVNFVHNGFSEFVSYKIILTDEVIQFITSEIAEWCLRIVGATIMGCVLTICIMHSLCGCTALDFIKGKWPLRKCGFIILFLFIGIVMILSGVLHFGLPFGYWEFVRIH